MTTDTTQDTPFIPAPGITTVAGVDRGLDAAELVVGLGVQKLAGSRLVPARLRYICRAAHGRMALCTAPTADPTAETACAVGAMPPANRA